MRVFIASLSIFTYLDARQSLAQDYCNWNDCDGEVQGGEWCNYSEENCKTCGESSPVPSTWCPGNNRYCNWNDCNGDVQGGNWCNSNEERCISCGNNGPTKSKWCAFTTGRTNPAPVPVPSAPASAPTPSEPLPMAPMAPTPLASGTATTTRYWDCNGGSCGCAYQPFAGLESHCYSNAMFHAPEGNPYGAKFYGTAAVSEALGGGNWFLDEGGVEGCGKCWKVAGTSNVPGTPVETTTLVLRGANFCPEENPACANGIAHFDIAAPGFDFLGASLSNTCASREPEELEGFQSCGLWKIDANAGCDCSKFRNEVLRAGCENFLSLGWDNPTVTYEELSECPPEMVTPCTYPYPVPGVLPATCASPGTLPLSAPTTPTQTPPTPTPTTPAAPTLPPTAPPTPTRPTPTPLGGTDTIETTGFACCSQDFKICENWCGDVYNKASCESCIGLYWLDKGVSLETCSARWEGCTTNYNGCCPGLQCMGNGGTVVMNGTPTGEYAQCLP